jgi:serine/threonine protein kinase
MEKGSLANLLENEKNMTYLQRLGLAIDIASGLSRIHDLNFIHRDIRPDNILVDANYKAKIADMGIAKVFKQRTDQTLAGCRDYMPPEFYTGNYTKKLDIFTFGLTLNELFGGKHVMWRGTNIHVEPKADVFYYFVEKCIDNEANNRPIAKSIESDLKLFNKVTNSFIEKLPPLTYAQKSVDEKNRIFKIVYDETLILYKNHNL